MKNIYIITLFFILLGCHNEDNPKVELQAGKYTLTDDPNDYVQTGHKFCLNPPFIRNMV